MLNQSHPAPVRVALSPLHCDWFINNYMDRHGTGGTIYKVTKNQHGRLLVWLVPSTGSQAVSDSLYPLGNRKSADLIGPTRAGVNDFAFAFHSVRPTFSTSFRFKGDPEPLITEIVTIEIFLLRFRNRSLLVCRDDVHREVR